MLRNFLPAKFNETGATQFTGDDTVADGAATLSGDGISLGIAGVLLTGSFGFSRGAAGALTVSLTNVTLALGEAPAPVSVTITSGQLTATAAGVYGSITGTPTVNVPGFSLSTNVTINLNTTSSMSAENAAGRHVHQGQRSRASRARTTRSKQKGGTLNRERPAFLVPVLFPGLRSRT